jgi:DNA-binding MarR family transcriptional regulator
MMCESDTNVEELVGIDREGEEPAEEVHVAMNAIRRIVRALRISSRAAEKALGVSGAQLFVLQQLAEGAARSDAAPSIAQLADLTATDPSSVSVVVSRLVSRGLAARRSSKADARRAEVMITPAGRALLQTAPQVVQHRMVEALVRLSTSRRQEMIAGLETVVAAMGVADQAASMFFEEEGETPSQGNRAAHAHNGNGAPHAHNGNGVAHAHNGNGNGNGAAHAHNGNGVAHAHNGNGVAHAQNGNGAAHPSEVDRGAPAP